MHFQGQVKSLYYIGMYYKFEDRENEGTLQFVVYNVNLSNHNQGQIAIRLKVKDHINFQVIIV